MRYEIYGNIEKFVTNFKTIRDSKSKFIFLMSQENVNISKINKIRKIQMADDCNKN